MKKANMWLILSILGELISLLAKGLNQQQASVCTAAKFNIPLNDVLNIVAKYINNQR